MSNKDQVDGEKIVKEILNKQLHQGNNPILRYKSKVLGANKGFLRLFQYELSQLFCANLGGGLGYLLRRVSMVSLFEKCGKGSIFGKGLLLRTPGNIVLGDKVAIDDHTLLDGGTGPACKMQIGDKVLISKGCVIQAKNGPLTIKDEVDIGAHVIISSAGGITLEKNVLIAGNCYIGGARYNLDALETPIMYQGVYSRGPITIGEGSWIGASVTILDGVTIGRGCVVGAGSLVTKNIPDFAIAIGSPAKVVRIRN